MKIKKISPYAIIPTRGSAQAAGYDLYFAADPGLEIPLYPGQTDFFPTGLQIEVPKGYFGAIFARSGLAAKKGLRPANCVGVIDSDYRGEVKVVLHNDSKEIQYIKGGDRIAQLIFIKYDTIVFEKVEELEETDRGEGGFGSTDK